MNKNLDFLYNQTLPFSHTESLIKYKYKLYANPNNGTKVLKFQFQEQ
jgi:hypothetical protein